MLAWTLFVLSLDCGLAGNFVDDGQYLVAAQALAEGKGYALVSRPGAPMPKYPPGLSLLLAPVLWLSGAGMEVSRAVLCARGLMAAAGWALAAALFAWLRRVGFSGWVACAVVTATLFHPFTVGSSIALMSELPFAALCFTLLLRWTRPERPRPVKGALLDGLLVAAILLVRGNGLTLLVAGAIASWRRWGVRAAGVFVASGLLGSALVRRALQRPDIGVAEHYSREVLAGWSSLGAGLSWVGANLRALPHVLGSILLPDLSFTRPVVAGLAALPPLRWLLLALLLGLLLLGLVELVRRVGLDASLPAVLHAVFTVGLFVVWPWEINGRFLIPVFPLALLCGALGAARVLPGLRRRADSLSLAAALFALVCAAPMLRVGVKSLVRQGGHWGDVKELRAQAQALAFVRERTEPHAVVATIWPEMLFLYTGRQGIPLIEADDQLVGRLGRWERIERWRAEAPGRPLYLLGAPFPPGSIQPERLLAASPAGGEPLTDGAYRLVRVRLPEAAPAHP